ncbi:MAG: hypothetical protein HY534_04865 [Chloroflexi bacterium]|nr:hypothetical protein [Chloroflexota bacterium]
MSASAGTWIALALFLFLLFCRLRLGLSSAGVGAVVCGVLCLYLLRRREGEARVLQALAIACFGWALGALLGSRPMFGLPLSFVESGGFVFALAATVGQVAWPEVRRGTLSLAATLADVLTLMAAVALWWSVGFAPIGGLVPGLTLETAAVSLAMLMPLAGALVVLPHLKAERRAAGGALAFCMAALVVAEVRVGSGRAWQGGFVFESAAFAAMAWGLLRPPSAVATGWPPLRDSPNAPILMPGLLAIAALVAAVVAVPRFSGSFPVAALVLGVALGAREVLVEWDRRRGHERLTAAFELGDRLMGLSVGKGAVVEDGLGEVCDCVADALRADLALVWFKEGSDLTLVAAGPDRLEELIGIRAGSVEDGDLAALAVATQLPETAEVVHPGGDLSAEVAGVVSLGSLLAVPIGRGVETLGALVVGRRSGGVVFSPSDQWKAMLVGGQIATVAVLGRRQSDLMHRLDQSTLVQHFASESVGARSLVEIGGLLLAATRSGVPFDRGSVRLNDGSALGGFRAIAHLSDGSQTSDVPRSSLAVPLLYGSTTVGEMLIDRFGGRAFSWREEQTAQALARFGAMVLYNRTLREDSEKVSTYRSQDRAKTDLLRTLSHDLRGSLTVIKGYAGRLVDSEAEMSDLERTLTIHTIQDEADRLTDLLTHLLDLSAIESGRMRLDLQAVNLRRVVEQARSGTERDTHPVELDVPDDLLVVADRRRLREVLDNLLQNAVKYSPDGGKITARARADGTEVLVTVSDCGIGIPRHLQERVFHAYERDEAGASRGIMGTGLGLAICKGLVEAHGGRIWVQSEVGLGSTFFFTVPAAPALVQSAG